MIFAASDIDLKTFATGQLSQMRDLADRVVIYIAANDGALSPYQVSRQITNTAIDNGRAGRDEAVRENQQEKRQRVQGVDAGDRGERRAQARLAATGAGPTPARLTWST